MIVMVVVVVTIVIMVVTVVVMIIVVVVFVMIIAMAVTVVAMMIVMIMVVVVVMMTVVISNVDVPTALAASGVTLSRLQYINLREQLSQTCTTTPMFKPLTLQTRLKNIPNWVPFC